MTNAKGLVTVAGLGTGDSLWELNVYSEEH